MEVNYIDGKMENGILIDWDNVFKEMKKLKIPSHVWTPSHLPMKECNWHVIFSRRDTGKTTNVLLMGMVLFWLYGVNMEYIRQKKTMIRAGLIAELFATILQYDYVSKITKGKYKNIWYHWGKFYFCNLNDGEKTPKDKMDKPFMICHGIDEWQTIKSGYVNPYGDLVLFDEFQSKIENEEEFLHFNQIISTIRRDRMSMKIILLGNTLSVHNYYFKELGVERIVEGMKPHDIHYHTSHRGTRIFLEYAEPLDTKKLSEKVKYNINLYHGFDNLSSITGDGWDIVNYPHITSELNKNKTISGRFYVDSNGYFMRCNICYEENFGTFIAVFPTKTIPEKEITFVRGRELRSRYEISGIGHTPQHHRLFAFFDIDRMLFPSNEVGEIMEMYINE